LGTIRYATRERIATLEIHRPQVKNALDRQAMDEIGAAIRLAERDRTLRALILTGSGEDAFISGGDLRYFQSLVSDRQVRGMLLVMRRLLRRIEHLRVPVIAAVNGYVVGGGTEVALACDLRIAAEGARIGLPETGLGLLPGAGGTQRLARIGGEATARRLILGAEVIDGTQAAALGIVHWAVPANDLAARARAIVRRIASMPANAPAEAKRCIAAALGRETPGYEMELEATARLLAQDETQRRVRAFLEKRRFRT
jgi:enoyl-CoA hydratase